MTAICPATMTYPEDVLAPIMDAAASYEAKRDGAALVGINMEGPYISPGNIGAQNPAYLHLPDEAMFRRLQERSGNLIKLVDVAPEVDGALDFIRSVSSDVRVSIAHTQADYDTACAAIEAGARQMTHLCNAMPPLHHRKPGPIGAAFDHSEVMPELIADGVHIHPSMMRLLFAAFGADRVILISDSMMATGLDDGEYSLGGQDVTVRGNVATLRSGTIAGSATDLMACVRVAVRDMGIPLDAAVRAASANPARALGPRAPRDPARRAAGVAFCVHRAGRGLGSGAKGSVRRRPTLSAALCRALRPLPFFRGGRQPAALPFGDASFSLTAFRFLLGMLVLYSTFFVG